MWKYVVNSMTYEAGEKENKKSFEELKKIADLMDVEIIFEGELPQTEKEQRVIYAPVSYTHLLNTEGDEDVESE